MAEARIVLSTDAESDLDILFDYIARDSGIDRAEAVLRRIEDTLFSLAASPRIGRLRPDLLGVRAFSVWPWLVLYEPLWSGDGISVWRVIDGRRDLPRHLGR
jgi:plasmid stabilization system protein ParE